MLSYWEQESLTEYDAIIIGCGIVGLSTAIALKEQKAKSRVLILERSLLPAGASSRNAGFACMGSVTELLDDLDHTTEDEIVDLFVQRKEGLSILRSRLGDEAIGYAANGSYELINEQEKYALEKIDYFNRLLLPVNKQPVFRLANDKIDALGLDGNYTKALIENIQEGELHTGKMVRSLMDHAITLGVEIKTGATVKEYEDTGSGVTVVVNDNVRTSIGFNGNQLFICTNAFTKELLPNEDVEEGRGQVLITKPIDGLKVKGVFHFDKGYYYFREIDNRVMIGGGRNLDFAGETTTDMATTQMIQDDLVRKLKEIVLPHNNFEVDMCWSGIMAFGKTKKPIVKAISQNVFGAFRMGGMGVAIGSLAGKQLATLASQ
ncbi:MAG: FAD-dependent oxidoreductase [Flavipsychrobacter sp.]